MLKIRNITFLTEVYMVKGMVFPVVMYGCESWTIKKAECWRTDVKLWCWRRLLRVPWESQDPTSQSWRKSILNSHWKDWCWSWSYNTLATWCEEPTHWKRPSCWERLRAEGEGGDRGWGGWMTSPTQWTWIWANSRRYWRTGKPGVLQSMGSQRIGHDWVTEQQQWDFPPPLDSTPSPTHPHNPLSTGPIPHLDLDPGSQLTLLLRTSAVP